jgi:hypothetical protein
MLLDINTKAGRKDMFSMTNENANLKKIHEDNKFFIINVLSQQP